MKAFAVIAAVSVFHPQSAFAAAPDAVDDSFSTASGTAVTDILSGNDLNLDGPSDQYSKATDPSNGNVSVNSDGSFTYTPNIGFAGTDQFSYTIEDGAGGSDTALVEINVASSSNFLTIANAVVSTPEDTAVPLGISVSPDLFDGGALLDIIATDVAYRSSTAGATPSASTIPQGTSSIVVTAYSTRDSDTSNSDDQNDDYQLLNARIDLTAGESSGRVAFLNNGSLTLLDQYNWEGVVLGQAVLADLSKVQGYQTGASNPLFKVVGDTFQIIENHDLETVYHIEYMTSDGDSTNFIGAGNVVQTAGIDVSSITLPPELEPASGKHGLVVLNSISASSGSHFAVEHKGFNRLVIDLDSSTISGSIAAEQGETANNTVTYGFRNYPLVDLRIGGTPVSVLSSTALVTGDTTSNSTVKDDPTIYIDAAGDLIVQRAASHSSVFTSMYTAEFYERTGYSSIASFVSVSSDDALFDANPVDAVDENGKPVNELVFDVPASARVGIFLVSWNTIGGNETNENIGMGFAVVDLEAGTSSGSITFIRASTPDLVSWDAVPFGQTFFGATSGGSPLYQSNKTSGSFTDQYGETAALALTDNVDGSRTLTFTATSGGGTQNFRDYRANAQVSWLGNEPFAIEGLQASDGLSHGSPTGTGEWEIDFAEIPLLTYTPAPHETGSVSIDFSLSSTGENEQVLVHVFPVADAPTMAVSDVYSYPNSPVSVASSLGDSADVDGSESQLTQVALSGVPSTVTLSASTGSVIDNGSGNWTISSSALSNLIASGTTALTATIDYEALNTDQDDIDGDGTVEDGDNGSGVDEFDELLLQSSFELIINEVPTVTSLIINSGTPVISGTASVMPGETLTVLVNGVTYTAGDSFLVDNGDGTWELSIPAGNSLAENTYSVSAQLSHSGGSVGVDLSADELIVDLTPPPAPGVTSQTTTNQTPLVSGTTTVGTGMVLQVVINGVTYTAGDGNLFDNGDGTWDLSIPTALTDDVYQVVATLTDAAGNSSTDPGIDDLIIDTTAPPTPGVTSLTTNNTTPVILGTATLIAGDTLSVEVNGITYTAGDGNLVDNGDGTWALNIPTSNALSEANYNVTATVTDLASNSATDPSSMELQVDLTAPMAPLVNALTTNQTTPVVSGSATVNSGDTLSVEVNGVTYSAGDGDLVDNSDGTWSLSIPAANGLIENTYEVVATVTDAAGNQSSDSSVNELVIDLTAPIVPTVTFQLTADATPVITGTATAGIGESLTVTVSGQLYATGDGNLIDNGDGTWVLNIPTAGTLIDGSYDVIASVEDEAGNLSTDITVADLVVDLTPPPAPGVTSQTTMDTTPLISGTTTVGVGLILTVEVGGIIYTAGDGNLSDNGDGTWDLIIPVPLPDATYQVVAILTDAAGNSATDSGVDELVIDTLAPPTPGVTSLATSDTTPVIEGTAIVLAGETLTVEVNSVVYTAGDGNLVDNGDATWTLTIPSANLIPEAVYDVTATVTDMASNTSTDPSSSELLIDTTAPAAPTVTAQTINTVTPVISGTATVNTGETLSVEINGVTYIAGDGNLVDNGDGTWDLNIPSANALFESTLDVTVTVTDAAGNTSADSTSGELIIDLTPPAVPLVTFLLTNNTEPTITGLVASTPDDTLSVEVNGVVYTDGDSNLSDNGDGTWMLTIPAANALLEATYDVLATLTDIAGNSTIDTSDPDLTIDLTPPPAPGVTSQTTMDTTPLISGTTTIGTGLTLTVEVDGVVYTAGDGNLTDNGDGSWDLIVPTALADATYQVIATLSDAAGNGASDSGTDELVVDTLAPPTPGVTSLTTNDVTPVIEGTAIVLAGDTLTVEVNAAVYTAGDGNLVDNGDGTWTLTIPAANQLPEAAYDVTATVTDMASNTSTDPSSGELLVDTTAPAAPMVTAQTINTTTPVISGTATVNIGETLTVEVNGITYTAGDGNLLDNGDGTWDLTVPAANAFIESTYDVTVIVTDAAGNTTTDATDNELIIDLTAPAVPTVTFLLTNNSSPSIAGLVTSIADDTLNVEINGVLYTDGDGNLTDNTDGTWILNVPVANALLEATYDVVVTLTDAAGNSAIDTSDPDLIIDLTPPPAPGVTSQTTMDTTPLISGTTMIGTGLTLTVEVDGVVYTAGDGNLTDNGDGSWDLIIPTALADATYQVIATLSDPAGNSASDSGTDELVVDTLAPPTPGVTSLTTNDVTPVIEGTAIVLAGDTLTVEVNAVVYTAGDGNLVNNGDGTWTLTIPAANQLSEAAYDVTATVTDMASNTSTDPSSGELLVDTTAPAAPMVTAQTINTTTPVISGTATVNIGETLTVEVNGVTYAAGDGNLLDNGDGTWDLSIPTANALSESILDVTVTVTDAAGNANTDSTNSELTIDLTPPAVPAVTFLLTNNTEPTITGLVASTLDDTLSVEVNGVLYTDGDGSLSDNRDGTWILVVPAVDALSETTYDVAATLTDTAGNSTNDISNPDLIIDVTPPPAPGVTSQTTMDTSPLISGTMTPGTGLVLTVEVDGILYSAGDGNLSDNGDGTWDLLIPTLLADATYQVIAILTDAAGNSATDPGIDELVVDTLAPPTPGVTSLTTNDTTPVIAGTATVVAGDTLTVEVNAIEYTSGDGNLVDNGDGTWVLTIPVANQLPEATYDVTAIVTDQASNTSIDPSSTELLVDTTAPVAPTVTAQTINTTTPVISGTAIVNAGELLSVEVNGVSYTAGDGNLSDNGDGSWDLVIPSANALTETQYDVTAIVTDAAGNLTTDSSVDELVIDLTNPAALVVTIDDDINDDGLLNSAESIGNADITIALASDVAVGDIISVTDGTIITVITLTAADLIADSVTTSFPQPTDATTLHVTANITDAAGNVSSDSSDSVIADFVQPSAPAIEIIEDTNNDLLINQAELVGNVDIKVSLPADAESGDTLAIIINGVSTSSILSAVHITASVFNAQTPSPGDAATLTVEASVTDAAGNTSGSNTDFATLDLTLPPVPSVMALLTNTATPTLAGLATVAAGDTLTVEVNGVTYTAGDGNLTDNGDGSWTLNIAAAFALPEGTLEVHVTVTDAAGNSNSDASLTELEVDLTAPATPAVTMQISNIATPVLSGTAVVNAGEILTVELNGAVYTAGDGKLVDNGDGTWVLSIPSADQLPEGTFDITASIADAAGNVTIDTTSGELIIDLTAPAVPTVTFLLTNNTEPSIAGIVASTVDDTLSVEVDGVLYIDGDGDLTDNGDGTWLLNIPVANALSEATYDVVATLTDVAGNSSVDITDPDLIIDLTPPPAPGVTSQTTMDTTPLISGTTTVGTGFILTVEVNGVVYTAGDGNLNDNGDGSWDLIVPTALPDTTYQVTATLTDAAGNSATDPGSDELVVDTLAPPTPGVTSLTTNDTTPEIHGTATLLASDTLSVEVNSVLYIAGDGNLVDNGDGTWTLAIPAANPLPEAGYDVTATVTDLANNTSTDPSSGELLVDTTAPVAPTVTAQTINTTTPVISGTATVNVGETLTVEVNGVTYTAGDGNLIDNGDGTWDLSIPAANALSESTFDITVTVTDAAGNTAADASGGELIIDLTPPPAPGVTSQTTMDTTPLISGTTTVGSGLVLTVEVDGIVYTAGDGNLTDNGDGSWDLIVPTPLPDTTYQVVATLTDAAGNSATDAGIDELVVDTVAPPTPGVTSLTTNDTTPVVAGTATVVAGETLTVEINSVVYTAGDGNLVDNGNGTWTLMIPAANALPEAVYDVTATVTDSASNTSTDPSSVELLIDITAPAAPGVTAQNINTTTPVISGTATVNTGETLTVEVNGVTYTAGDGDLVDNGDGTWDLTIPTADALAESILDVTVTVTDAAGNSTADSTSGELIIDLTAPAVPTVTFLLTNNTEPSIAGTVASASTDTLSVEVNGVLYSDGDGDLTDNGDGTWVLNIPAANALLEATYDVVATLTDVAGNSAADISNPDLIIDLSAPPAPGVTSQTTMDTTPLISGTTTIGSGLVLTVEVDGVVYTAGDGNLNDNGDGSWDLIVPTALPDAVYQVIATLTDAAGNSATDPGIDELVVDTLAPPTPGVTSVTTNDTTPVIHGTATLLAGDILSVEVNGVLYIAGDGNLVDNGDGTWTLTIPAGNLLPEAGYDVTATVTDLANNTSTDPSSGELLVDTTAPVAPTVIAQITNTTSPVISGTATLNPGEILTVEVNGVTYMAGDGSLVDNGDGTWDLSIPVANALSQSTLDVAVTVTDAAGNTTTDASNGELVIDTTPPSTPIIDAQATNTTTPLITGNATLTPGEILTVEINGITYTAGDGVLIVNSDGSWSLQIPNNHALPEGNFDITAVVTDSAGNSTVSSSTNELDIDLTPPVAPTVEWFTDE